MQERAMVLRLVRDALVRVSSLEQRVAALEIAQLEQAAMVGDVSTAVDDLQVLHKRIEGGT